MQRKVLFPAAILIVALSSLLILGGCGEKSQDPKEALTAATAAAREAGSAHTQMNVTISPLEGEAGMGLNVQGDAWLDMDTRVVEARFTVMGLELSLRYVDGDAYVQFGGTWYILQPDAIAGVGEGTLDALVEVLTSIPDIISSGVEAKELGDKKVGNYDCMNLEVSPDLEAVTAVASVQKLATELDMSQEELVQFLQDADIVMEVCVQKDEPVIREVYIAATLELPSVAEIVGIDLLPEVARVEIIMDFPEYGMEVDVQVPEDAKPFEGL